MADSEGKNYYWKSLNQNTTGENVGAVLDDLSDIKVTPEEELDDEHKAIIVEYDEDLGRNKFKLGAAGSRVEIPGDDNQLVVADGQGNAKANLGNFYSKAENAAAQLLTSKSILELGTTITTGPPYSYWNYAHDKMQVRFTGNPFFQMNTVIRGGSPIFSMQGTSIVEINGDNYGTVSPQGGYARNSGYRLSSITSQVYEDHPSPLNNNKKLNTDELIYPYLHMGQSSTLIMEGASMIKTSDGAGMELSGNATFKVNGAGCSDEYPVPPTGRTFVAFHPGSFFSMASGCYYNSNDRKWVPVDNSGKNHGPLFSMNSSDKGGQIILTNQWAQNVGEGDQHMDWNEFWNAVDYKHTRIFGLNDSKMYEGLRSRVHMYRICSLAQYTSNVYQSTFGVQGKTNIIIGGAGSGVLAARIATEKYTVLDWAGKGEMDIKIGEGVDSAVTIDIGDNDSATGYYKICPEKESETIFLFEPSSKTSINFSPNGMNDLKPQDDTSKGYCGIDFTPYKTELDCRWYKLNADFQGNDAFIQTTGNFHVENHAGTFILRGSQEVATGADLKASNRAETHLHRLWQGIYASDNPAPILQLYDKANFAMYGDATIAPPTETKTYYLYKEDFPNEPTKQDFETTESYQSFIDGVPDSYIWDGSYDYSCESDTSVRWKITISYNYTYTEHITEIPAPTDSPVFEMRSASELRVRDGAYIKAQTIEGETTIIFGSNRSQEEPVSFTLAELKNLKRFIGTIPSRIINDDSEATEPNTLYFIPEE